jgi:VanZ family protein
VLSLVPPNFRPETPLPHTAEHFVIFAAAGGAFGIGYSNRRRFTIACLVIFAGAIELAQLTVPGRHARLNDFVVDAIALVIGNVIGATLAVKLGVGFERSESLASTDPK